MKPVFLFLAVMAILSFFRGAPTSAEFYAHEVNPKCDTILFTTEWCGACKKAIAYFEKKNYSYCEYNVESQSPEVKYYHKLQTKSVPTILIGNQVSVGFNSREIDSLVKLLE